MYVRSNGREATNRYEALSILKPSILQRKFRNKGIHQMYIQKKNPVSSRSQFFRVPIPSKMIFVKKWLVRTLLRFLFQNRFAFVLPAIPSLFNLQPAFCYVKFHHLVVISHLITTLLLLLSFLPTL